MRPVRHACLVACLLAPLGARAQSPSPSPPPAPAQATSPARLLHSALPTPPPMAPGQAVDVVLVLEVDAAGRVTGAEVAQSGGADFDAAALAAARQFVFSPARVDGKPVPTRVTYRSRFVGPPAPARPASPSPSPSPPSPAGPSPSPTAAASALPAQPLLGEVRARGDRVPQAGVHVLVDDGAHAAVTDARGRFVIDDLTTGEHVVHFRGQDLRPLDEKVRLRVDLPTLLQVWVDVAPRYVSRVRGRTVLQDAVEQTISADEIRHIAGTQGDTLKAVQNLPGVARPPYNAGLLAVWGSPPEDTRVYVDGVAVPTLYHLGGWRSTVNAALIDSLTLLPGGYDVEHGRGLGGVVELETRAPRSDGWHGFAQADLADVSAMVEAGLGRRFSFAGAFRVSWLEFFLPAFRTAAMPKLDPKYWDYQLDLHLLASANDTVDLFFFGSNDTLDLALDDPNTAVWHEFIQHTYFHRALLRWVRRFARGATLTVTPSVGYDVPYGLDVTVGNATWSHAEGQLGFGLRAVARVPLGRLVRLEAGVDYEGTRFTLDARQNPGGLYREGDTGGFLGYTAPDPSLGVLTDHMTIYTNQVAPFASLTLALFHQRLLVMPQLRLETMTFSPSGTYVLFEPRLALRVRVSSRVALQASLGVYHQAPLSADFSSVFGNPLLAPERAVQYVAGVEARLWPTLHVELQGFYKDLRALVTRGALPADPLLDNDGVGRAYGLELLVRQELWRHFFGWISYTLSRSERRDHPGDPWRPFQFDQTHILTLVASYQLPWGLQLGLRFRYATGNPYTPVARAYYDVNSGAFIPIYGAPYSARLPAFNQLDARIDKRFVFDRWTLVVYLDVQNVYDANSAEGVTYSYDYRRTQYLNGLPLLPVFGARGEF